MARQYQVNLQDLVVDDLQRVNLSFSLVPIDPNDPGAGSTLQIGVDSVYNYRELGTDKPAATIRTAATAATIGGEVELLAWIETNLLPYLETQQPAVGSMSGNPGPTGNPGPPEK